MNFEEGKQYSHKNMVDVCFEVIQNFGNGILSVAWYKKNGLNLNARDQIVIKPEEMENYSCYKN